MVGSCVAALVSSGKGYRWCPTKILIAAPLYFNVSASVLGVGIYGSQATTLRRNPALENGRQPGLYIFNRTP